MSAVISTPQALFKPASPEDHWVATHKTPELRGELDDFTPHNRGPLIRGATFSVWYAERRHFSPQGFGTVRVRRAEVPCTDSGTVLSATVSPCTGIGTASFLNRRCVHAIVDGLPSYSEVWKEVSELATTLLALEAAEQLPYRSWKSFDLKHGWEHCLITTPEYGVVWVPKEASAGLLHVDVEPTSPKLVATHVAVDGQATKHALMRQLGIDAAIAIDERLVGNALARGEAR